MFRCALSLLLTLPLLLPPGVCVCALAHIGEVCADDACAAAAGDCCDHDDLPLDDGEDAAQADDDADRDDTHHPACPAHKTGVQWKCRVSPPELIAATALSALQLRVPPDAGAHFAVAAAFTSTRPIYLTTLTLRI